MKLIWFYCFGGYWRSKPTRGVLLGGYFRVLERVRGHFKHVFSITMVSVSFVLLPVLFYMEKNELSCNKNLPLYFLSKASKTFSVKSREVGSNMNQLHFSFIIDIEYTWKCWITQGLEMKSATCFMPYLCFGYIKCVLFCFYSKRLVPGESRNHRHIKEFTVLLQL